MGTRCLTVLTDDDGAEIAVLYRQFDGYPEAHGVELAKFLSGRRIVNGIGDDVAVFNGMPCLAAAVVAHFKAATKPGGFYLHAAGTRDCGEEYTYQVVGEVGASEARIILDDGVPVNASACESAWRELEDPQCDEEVAPPESLCRHCGTPDEAGDCGCCDEL